MGLWDSGDRILCRFRRSNALMGLQDSNEVKCLDGTAGIEGRMP